MPAPGALTLGRPGFANAAIELGANEQDGEARTWLDEGRTRSTCRVTRRNAEQPEVPLDETRQLIGHRR